MNKPIKPHSSRRSLTAISLPSRAEMIQAQEALRSYLDKDALMAQALGITVEELQAAVMPARARLPCWTAGMTAGRYITALKAPMNRPSSRQ